MFGIDPHSVCSVAAAGVPAEGSDMDDYKAMVFYHPAPDPDKDPILSVRIRMVAARIPR